MSAQNWHKLAKERQVRIKELTRALKEAQTSLLWMYGEVLTHARPRMPKYIEKGLGAAAFADHEAERARRRREDERR
jgi:hypothetical protein